MMNLTVPQPAVEIDNLFEHIPLPQATRLKVKDHMMGEGRHYHGLYHLASMWRAHRLLKAHSSPSYLMSDTCDAEIACAIAFHDVVMNPFSKTNEVDSALFWEREFATNRPSGISGSFVSECIIATESHFDPSRTVDNDRDRRREWFVGLDLVSLAAETRQFEINTGLIRLEYADLSDEDWRKGRGAFLAMVDTVNVIFRDNVLHDLFETKARANIARALSRGV